MIGPQRPALQPAAVTRRTSLAHTVKVGALAGLALGVVLVVVVLVVDSRDLLIGLWAGALFLGVFGLVFGALFWAIARVFMRSFARGLQEQQLREPLRGMMWERAFLWIGIPAAIVFVLLSALSLARGETLF